MCNFLNGGDLLSTLTLSVCRGWEDLKMIRRADITVPVFILAYGPFFKRPLWPRRRISFMHILPSSQRVRSSRWHALWKKKYDFCEVQLSFRCPQNHFHQHPVCTHCKMQENRDTSGGFDRKINMEKYSWCTSFRKIWRKLSGSEGSCRHGWMNYSGHTGSGYFK